VRWIDKVLEVALERMPVPLPDDEPVAVSVEAAKAEPAAAVSADGLPH
jgi:ATP-dependent Lon protease